MATDCRKVECARRRATFITAGAGDILFQILLPCVVVVVQPTPGCCCWHQHRGADEFSRLPITSLLPDASDIIFSLRRFLLDLRATRRICAMIRRASAPPTMRAARSTPAPAGASARHARLRARPTARTCCPARQRPVPTIARNHRCGRCSCVREDAAPGIIDALRHRSTRHTIAPSTPFIKDAALYAARPHIISHIFSCTRAASPSHIAMPARIHVVGGHVRSRH